MATYQPPKINTQFIYYIALVSQADTKLLKSSPTLATGDFKTSLDGGSFANLGTLPTVTPSSSVSVKVTLATSEMNGANATVSSIDAAGAEWCDRFDCIQTSARQVDDLAYPATSGRSMVVDASGVVDANAVKVGPTAAGTAQTARDLGASVLLSAGTGTGQLDFTSGVVKANLAQILGTALTETAGLLAGGFKKLLNVAAPTGTLNSLPDAVPDAAGGLPVTGTRLTAIPTVARVTLTDTTTDLTTKTGFSLSAGGVQAIWDALTSALTTVGSIGKWIVDKIDVVVSTRLASASYTAPDNASAALAAASAATAVTQTTAAAIRADVGLASANLDTQLGLVAKEPQGIKKNTALANFSFPIFSSTDHITPQTGLTVTATKRIDAAAAFSACANAVTEIGATGFYTIDFAPGDLNGDVIALKFAPSVGGDVRTLTIRTVA